MTPNSSLEERGSLELARSRQLLLPHYVTLNAWLRPEKVALVCGDRALTFGELEERTNRLANALAARGVKRGDNVALLMRNAPEVVEAWLGCHKIGACPVPISFRFTHQEIDDLLDDSASVGIIVDGALVNRALAPTTGANNLRFRVIVGGPDATDDGYEAALASAQPASPAVLVDDDDLAFLLYTSGTTGRPKGAMLSHKNIWMHTANWVHELRQTADDTFVTGMPLFHVAGLNHILPCLYVGGTAVFYPSGGFDAGVAIATLARHRATMSFFVPTQWLEICRHPSLADLDRTRLRTVAWGGSQAPLPTLELLTATFPNSEITNAFGQTETCGATCMLTGREDSVRKIGSVGKPVINVGIRIVDDQMNDVPRGEIGEIVYRGPTVMLSYFRADEATAEAFEGGWFHSGDLVRQDGDGYIYVVGRKKDVIISGGENIYPAELEAVLSRHPAVAEVAVVGMPHPRWVETPVAIVVLNPTAHVSEDELIALCTQQIASYKKPSAIVFVDALPRNPSGKVLKGELRDQWCAVYPDLGSG